METFFFHIPDEGVTEQLRAGPWMSRFNGAFVRDVWGEIFNKKTSHDMMIFGSGI